MGWWGRSWMKFSNGSSDYQPSRPNWLSTRTYKMTWLNPRTSSTWWRPKTTASLASLNLDYSRSKPGNASTTSFKKAYLGWPYWRRTRRCSRTSLIIRSRTLKSWTLLSIKCRSRTMGLEGTKAGSVKWRVGMRLSIKNLRDSTKSFEARSRTSTIAESNSISFRTVSMSSEISRFSSRTTTIR